MKKLRSILIFTILIATMSVAVLASAASVIPELWTDWKSGNAEFECSQISSGANLAYKIDDWDQNNGMDGTYVHGGATITISNSDGKTFDWSSDTPILAVIVKASTKAYVYRYEGGSFGDTGLVAPEGKDISHVTFCIGTPSFVVPEVPLGTIVSVLTMLGAAALFRAKPISI